MHPEEIPSPLCEIGIRTDGDAAPRLRVSVVMPLTDDRGFGRTSVESWTRLQQCAPGLFELIALYDPKDRAIASAVKDGLRSGDRLVEFSASNVVDLYRYGAEVACGDILFFTESHCVADPCNVVEILDVFDHDRYDGFTARGDTIALNELGRMEGLYFDDYAVKRADPSRWDQVSLRGFAVKASAYRTAGGFQARFDIFAERLMAADMHRRGLRLGYVPKVGVRHVSTENFFELNKAIRDFVHGECLFISSVDDPVQWQDYFKIPPLSEEAILTMRQRRAATSLLWALSRRALAGRPLMATVSHTIRHLPSALKMDRLLRRQGVRAMAARFAYHAWFASPNRRVKSFFNYWDRLADFYRIRWYLEQEPRSSLTGKRTETFGFHEAEYENNVRIRWSEPMAGIQIPAEPGRYTAVLCSPHIRECTRRDGLSFVMNGKLLDAKTDRQAGEIRLSLDAGHFASQGTNWLYIAVRPWRLPSESADNRLIGIPLSEIRLESADGGSPTVAWRMRF